MTGRLEPGERAYHARFDHIPERHRERWAALDPVAKAIWARVEAACQSESPSNCEDLPPSALSAFREGYASAYRPGRHYEAQCAGLRAVIRLMRGGAAHG